VLVTVERTSMKPRCNDTDREQPNWISVPLYQPWIPTRTGTGIEAGPPRGESDD